MFLWLTDAVCVCTCKKCKPTYDGEKQLLCLLIFDHKQYMHIVL